MPFIITAVLALAIAVVALAGGAAVWTAHFAACAVLFTVNWYASAVLLRGISERRTVPLLLALQVKLASFGALFALFMFFGADVTALLAGLHLYFVAFALWHMVRRRAAQAAPPVAAAAEQLPLKGAIQHG
ncbi:MAG: hypothetical protein SF028_06845 [Candidatus Sumerlaeia bacterium]|nr:hypothetical protein [Candidatus Sumerlaeia bacterium]